jgi:hypothetical protein
VGRKSLVLASIVGSIGVLAGPAAAKTRHTHARQRVLTMHVKVVRERTLSRSMGAKLAIIGPIDTVYDSQYKSECTTPRSQNFYTTDTAVGFSAPGGVTSVCLADLSRPQLTGASGSKTASYFYNKSTVESAVMLACRVYLPPPMGGGTAPGTGYAVTLPNGMFVEVCNAGINL